MRKHLGAAQPWNLKRAAKKKQAEIGIEVSGKVEWASAPEIQDEKCNFVTKFIMHTQHTVKPKMCTLKKCLSVQITKVSNTKLHIYIRVTYNKCS